MFVVEHDLALVPIEHLVSFGGDANLGRDEANSEREHAGTLDVPNICGFIIARQAEEVLTQTSSPGDLSGHDKRV